MLIIKPNPPQTLRKHEILSSKLDLNRLYNTGNHLKQYPVKLLYSLEDEQSEIKIAFSVPKRSFKRAVDRNLLKRRLREVYRKHKTMITQVSKERGVGINIMVILIGKERVEYKMIEIGFLKALNELKSYIETYETD